MTDTDPVPSRLRSVGPNLRRRDESLVCTGTCGTCGERVRGFEDSLRHAAANHHTVHVEAVHKFALEPPRPPTPTTGGAS